jgi:hypothetical protein
VGVIPFLEASSRRMRHAPRSLGVGGCLRAKASIRCWIGTLAASLTSYLCWEPCVWRHDWVRTALLRCPPLSSAGPRRRYVRSSPVSPRRCFLQIGASPAFHLPLLLRRSGWMVRRQAMFFRRWSSSEASGVGRDAVCVSAEDRLVCVVACLAVLSFCGLVREWCGVRYARCSQRVVVSCNFNSAFYKDMVRLGVLSKKKESHMSAYKWKMF